MRLFGRRIFNRGAMVAPAAGLLMVGATTPPHRTIPVAPSYPEPGSLFDTSGARTIVEPPGLPKYREASRSYFASKEYRGLLTQARRDALISSMNTNIAVLKSVSAQHKYHMMVKRAIVEREEERTFTERLMDTFGVREFFSRNDYPQAGASSRGFL